MISIIVTAFFVFLFIFWSIKPIPPCQGISFRGESCRRYQARYRERTGETKKLSCKECLILHDLFWKEDCAKPGFIEGVARAASGRIDEKA